MLIAANADKFGVKTAFIFVTTVPIKAIALIPIAEHAALRIFKAYIVDITVGTIVKSTEQRPAINAGNVMPIKTMQPDIKNLAEASYIRQYRWEM